MNTASKLFIELEEKMKKFLSFATLSVTIFLLVACGSSSKSENSASSDKVELSSKPKIDGLHRLFAATWFRPCHCNIL